MAVRLRIWLSMFLAAVMVACASPEAMRARGGGPGADPGNRRTLTEIHGGARVYYRTPCRLPTACR